ncbi:MAG TPA: hypothetical protein DET40_23120 [Lentisphaeria bacterium]|nr:MAG: hypothetical protein A2X45_20710 [Lentisphaerae bacterium GWF2_50_93]HCE46446.1 hypothetical protein [Lentisphaeria bacterium]
MKNFTYLVSAISICLLASCASTKPPEAAATPEPADVLNASYRFEEAEKLFDSGVGKDNEANLQDAMNAYWIFICRNVPSTAGAEIKSEKDLLKINGADDPRLKTAKEKFLVCKKILAEKFNRKTDFKVNPVMIRHLAE